MKMKRKELLICIVVCLAAIGWSACNNRPEKLPVLGERTLSKDPLTGKTDTVILQFPYFI
ncbi:hypothetical protein [Chitinophaga pinensis]|uniref:hypothetical protein n=1 Tax=Chitinophaga pinensis TaxID=79329 RepID=UPI001C99ECEE|nr:hypothetical protein [Chitinophaga pinensis]